MCLVHIGVSLSCHLDEPRTVQCYCGTISTHQQVTLTFLIVLMVRLRAVILTWLHGGLQLVWHHSYLYSVKTILPGLCVQDGNTCGSTLVLSNNTSTFDKTPPSKVFTLFPPWTQDAWFLRYLGWVLVWVPD